MERSRRGKVKFADYAATWIAQRPRLRPRTTDLYRWVLGKHITPYLGGVPVGKLSTAMIREWRSTLLGSGVSITRAAKAYRLLRAVLMTAVEEDNILLRNPCRIRGAGDEDAPERALWQMADDGRAECNHDRRYLALVLLASFASLRWGEVTALRRCDLDLEAGTVRICAMFVERSTGEILLGPPKSKAGRRVVGIPQAIIPVLREHLSVFVKDEPGALVFPGVMGGPLRRGNFNRMSAWAYAVRSIGAEGLHFHDLRHTGNTFAASSGASLRDLMARMGHDSERAAMIYQHEARGADQAITRAIDTHVQAEQANDDDDDDDDDDDGSAGVLAPVG